MRRVVAVLGAVLMVVVAVLVRGVLDDDDGDGNEGPSGGGTDGRITLLCVEELREGCEALEAAGAIDGFDVEPAGATVDRMADQGTELGADAWLTFERFPQMADVAREENGLGPAFPEVAATSSGTRVAVAVVQDRTSAWRQACGGDVEWSCIGDLVGEPWSEHEGERGWGDIRIGFDSPSESATGLLVVTQAVAAHLDDPDFERNDLEAGGASRWLRDLSQDLSGRESRTLDRMITQRGSYSLVGTLWGNASEVVDSQQGLGTGITYPAPMYAAEVVVAAPSGAGDDLVADDELREALGGSWVLTGDVVDLPDPGTLYALRELVS